MKKIVFLILFLVSSNIFAQVEYKNGKAIIDSTFWVKVRDKGIEYYFDSKAKDTIINECDSIINIQKSTIALRDSIIRNQQAIIAKIPTNNSSEINIKDKPFLEWIGAFTGFKTWYDFNTANAQSTFAMNLKYGIYFNVNLKVKDILITPELAIPLQINESSNINIRIGYKLF